MLVHFAAPQQNILKEINYYREIVKTIHSQGDSLTRDWLEPAYQTASKTSNFSGVDWPTVYKENMEALARADVVIADVTLSNFAIGYMVAVGIQQKKPTLLLFREKAVAGTMASGMDESLVTLKEYDIKNLDGIVSKFLETNRIDTKDMRFNFFIDRPIYNYLRWAAYKTGKTKAEILRELVTREIDKSNDINQL